MAMEEFQGKKPKVHKTCYIAGNSMLIGDVEIGENSSVWYGSVLRGDMHYIKNRQELKRAGQFRPAWHAGQIPYDSW